MFEVPKSFYDRLIALLTPLMDIIPKRQGWVLPAFQGYPKLLEKIDWSGDAHSFTVRLVDLCLNHGDVEPGKQALIVLLEAVHLQVGHDRQQEIDDLRSQLGKPAVPPAVTPYRGLQPFRVEDKPFFFGRDKMIASLVAKVLERNFVVVVGNSGSGKSSLVRAGLMAQLQKNLIPDGTRWEVALMRPLTDPLREFADLLIQRLDPNLAKAEKLKVVREYADQLLKAALATQPDKAALTIKRDIEPALRKQLPETPYFLLIVDQFEENFDPRIKEELRQGFIHALLDAHATGWFKIVLVLRSDFYNFLLKYRLLAELADQALLNVLSMNAEERQAAIEQPALHTGRRFEAGLVKRIVADIEDAPGDLPLLQFALTELWQRQTPDGGLTHAAYDVIGGVSGAIAQHAQAVYQKLADTPNAQMEMRILFERRLVKIPGPGTALEHAIRRRINLDDLNETTQNLITNTLTAQGLLVTDRDEITKERTVEIVHEALIQHWGELQGWLTQNQENLRIHQTLTEAVEIWARFQHRSALLYHGEQLKQARAWATGHADELIAKERDFLKISQHWVWYRWAGMLGGIALAVLLLLIFTYWNPWSSEVAIPMPANDFNIAIATFGIQDLNLINDQNLKNKLERDSKTFSVEIAKFLEEHEEKLEKELNSRNVNILRPQRFELEGTTFDALSQKAQELQADIIIYGNLNQGSGRRWQVVPRYYIVDRTVLERAREAFNEDILSKSVSYIPGNSDDVVNVLEQLLPRLNTLLVFSRGLPSYDLGNEAGYEKASQIFCESAKSTPQNNGNGTELLYFFCAKAKEQLAWLRRNDAGWEPTLLNEAFTAYKTGLELNPDYLRIQVNLAALLVQVYRPVMLDCNVGDSTKLTEAKKILEAAIAQINLQTAVPDGTKAVAFLHLGHAYFWIGRCYGDLQADWTTATTHYEHVIRMQDLSMARADLIDYSVAVAHVQKGIMALWMYGINQSQSADSLLTTSIADFKKAIAILFAMQDDRYVADYTKEMMPYALMAFCVGKQNHVAEQYLNQLSDLLPGFDRAEILNNMNPVLRKDCGL